MRLAPGELTYLVSFSGGDQICSQKFSRRHDELMITEECYAN